MFLTILWNVFQSSKFFNDLQFPRSLLQSLFHQLLEYLVMLMILELFSQALLILLTNSLMMLSKLVMLDKLDVLRFLMDIVIFLMKATSSLLSLMIECLAELILFSMMGIVIVRGTQSDIRCQSGCIKWLFNLLDPPWRNMRLMTKFESLTLSEYLFGTQLVELNKSRLNKSAAIRRSSLIVE